MVVFSRQRDLFPLPLLDAPHGVSRAVCRSTARRIQRKAKWRTWANDGILTLNSLCGRGSGGPRASGFSTVAIEVSNKIGDAYASLGPPPSDLPSPEGALSELLGADSFYSGERLGVAPYAKDLVSWPAPGSQPMCLRDGLALADRDRLDHWKDHMQRRPADAAHILAESGLHRAHNDQELFRSPACYGDFLCRLDAAGMLRWRIAGDESGVLGVFFVRKKNGKLRLILDTRILNTRFFDAPKTQLPSAAACSASLPGRRAPSKTGQSAALTRTASPPSASARYVFFVRLICVALCLL